MKKQENAVNYPATLKVIDNKVYSYDTLVGIIEDGNIKPQNYSFISEDGKVKKHSNTTSKHINIVANHLNLKVQK